MSPSLWCDRGRHSFSANDPDKQNFKQTRTVPIATLDTWGKPYTAARQEVSEELDICGPCWAKQNMFQPPAEILECESEAEQSEADMWKAKYEAEKARTMTIRIEPES